MKNFFKGIICGLGGVSPGLSGSVMLVIFGLYNKTIESIGTFFKKPKEHFLYLFPIFLGLGIGILIFGKIVSMLLIHYEMITRLTFLGFIPLFFITLSNLWITESFTYYNSVMSSLKTLLAY